ncbi:MAG TPA: hypothetical protein VNH84_03380 [Candidatus Saccharimonadales bacterium]|nr:hypothetical protein [Candidatus Saccharimonadales bacterium]
MLIFILVACFLAFAAAWTVNALIGVMSGEHPKDTGRQFVDTLLRLFGIAELGVVGFVLDHFRQHRWIRWLFFGAAILFVLSAVSRLHR